MAEMQAEVVRLGKEIRAASDDVERVNKLQNQMQALFTDVMTKVSPRSRPTMEVYMKVTGPFLEKILAYNEAEQRFTDAGGYDFTSASSAEVIDHRLKQLAEIERMNADLIKRTASFDADIKAVLKTSTLSAAERTEFLKGFYASPGGRLGGFHAVRALDARLYTEVRGIYGQLREQLGKWSVEDESIAFDGDAQVSIYNARIERIEALAEQQEVVERRARSAE